MLAAALTTPILSPSNDSYDAHDHDPVTPTPAQRQQPRSLRRTHIEATSAGISPPRVRFTQGQQQQQARSELAHDFEDDATSTQVASSSQHISPEAERRPHRALRISKNTASAILYALEEALRHPNAFTPDLVEENAQMSDLLGGGPSASAGNGRSGNGRPTQPPGTTGSPSGIKGPRDIMRERQAREARRKAEQEQKVALERNRAEEEQRQIEEDRRRRAAAGAAQRVSGDTAPRNSGGTTGGQRISDNSQRSQRTSGGGVGGNPPLQGIGQGGRAVGGGENAGANRPTRPAQAQAQPQPRPAPESRPRPEAGPSTTAGPSGTQQSGTAGAQTRSSFPHAFERWETLSAHWEGLTSFWIRRLEENSVEVNRDPLSQQLSRQVTDLSAAGANLFHAVVELQRLRASSERKFQRWFFETRAELERHQEIQAMTQAALEQERSERSALIAAGIAKESEKSNFEKQMAEMKRELQISKEEARRAWEELGRREEEERDRTASLRDGQPTLVGGVQVVPMMQGVPSRHGSTRDPQPPYTGSTQPEGPVDEGGYSEYVRVQREPADPFTSTTTASSSRQTPATYPGPHPAFSNSSPQGQAPAVQPASTSAFYQQHQATSVHPSESERVPSEAAFSEEEYEIDSQGQFIRDARGNKVRYQAPASDDDDDEYDVNEQREREIANLARYGPAATSAPTSVPSMGPTVDYSGTGYGGGSQTEWAAVPRHHHPTRLSDVLEEDERSRTSASQVSRRE